jgi:hypothetical protein
MVSRSPFYPARLLPVYKQCFHCNSILLLAVVRGYCARVSNSSSSSPKKRLTSPIASGSIPNCGGQPPGDKAVSGDLPSVLSESEECLDLLKSSDNTMTTAQQPNRGVSNLTLRLRGL